MMKVVMKNNSINKAEETLPSTNNEFFDDIQKLDVMKIFARVLPRWSTVNNADIRLIIEGNHEEVGFGITLPANRQKEHEELYLDLIRKLKDTEDLMKLTYLIDEFRRVGVDPEEINVLVNKAELLARKIHPEQEY